MRKKPQRQVSRWFHTEEDSSHPCLAVIRTGVSRELEKKNIFVVPFAKGVRVSVASVAEDKCRVIPAAIKEVLDKMEA